MTGEKEGKRSRWESRERKGGREGGKVERGVSERGEVGTCLLYSSVRFSPAGAQFLRQGYGGCASPLFGPAGGSRAEWSR